MVCMRWGKRWAGMNHTIKSDVLTVHLSDYAHGWRVERIERYYSKKHKNYKLKSHKTYHATFEQAAMKIIDMNVAACTELDQLQDALETVRDRLLELETK